MSETKVNARDENVRNLPRQRGRTPMETHDRLSAEIPDIFIPPTQVGNAGVRRGRNENSGMTTGGNGEIRQAEAWERQIKIPRPKIRTRESLPNQAPPCHTLTGPTEPRLASPSQTQPKILLWLR